MAEFKQSKHIFKGMNRDISPAVPEARSTLYYNALNVRINTVDNETQLCITNEKAPQEVKDNSEVIVTIQGNYLGHAIIDNILVVFSHVSSSVDAIEKFVFNEETVVEHTTLYRGNLNFSNKIETTCYVQNENEKIVYWVDGINQPRRINIAAEDDYYIRRGNTQFDFTLDISSNTFSIKVEKLFDTSSSFKGGTIQYFLTAIGTNKQESGIIYQTPLYYPSDKDKAVAPEKTAKCSFKVTVQYFQKGNNIVNKGIDKLRLYAVERTSADTDGYCRVIKDFEYSSITEVIETFTYDSQAQVKGAYVIDDGGIGESYDVRSLLLKQGTSFVAETLAQKDSALFLGNLTILNNDVDINAYIEAFKATQIGRWSFKDFNIQYTESTQRTDYYKYSNVLNKSSFEIQTFKFGEYYRFGIQLQDKYGNWTSPIHVGDVYNDRKSYNTHENFWTNNSENYYLVRYSLALDNLLKTSVNDKTLLTYLRENDFINIRPTVIFPEKNRRNVVAQGVVSPTVFNIGWRKDSTTSDSPYAMSSWFFRPFYSARDDEALGASSDLANKMYQMEQDRAYNGTYSGQSVTGWRSISYLQANQNIKNGMPIPYKHHSKIRGGVSKMGEIQALGALDDKPIITNSDRYDFYIDQSIATLNSPEVDFSDEDIYVTNSYKIRLIEAIPIISTVGKTYVELLPGTPADILYEGNTAQQVTQYLTTTSGTFGMVNSPLFEGATSKKVNDSYHNEVSKYVIYPFQVTGSLSGIDNSRNVLGKKIVANLRYSHQNIPLNPNTSEGKRMAVNPINIPDIVDIAYAKDALTRLDVPWGNGITTINYYKDIDNNLDAIQLPDNYPQHFANDVESYIDEHYAGLRSQAASGVEYWGTSWILGDTNNPYSGYSNTGFPGYVYGSKIWISTDPPTGLVPNVSSDPYTYFIDLKQQGSGNTSLATSYLADKLTSICYASSPHIVFSLPIKKYNVQYGPIGSQITEEFNFQEVLPDIIVDGNIPTSDTPYRQFNHGQGWNGFYDYENSSDTHIKLRFYADTAWSKFSGSGPLHFTRPSDFTPNTDSWGQSTSGICHPIIDNESLKDNYQLLWLAEVYKQDANGLNSSTIFPDEENGETQKWLVGGKSIALLNKSDLDYKYYNAGTNQGIATFESYDEGNQIDENTLISPPTYTITYNNMAYDSGDTYYQRYDCLKTYPHSNGTDNNIIDILSFMCESHINLASRYDNYRGLRDNTVIDETLYNILNSGYTQNDNLFTYQRIENKVYKFANQVTWSSVKDHSRTVDNWTNITLANVIDVNGDRGAITALKNFRGQLLSFQKTSVNEILYNPTVQISSTSGLPIEIANSATVSGIRNIFTDSGTTNKWSICTTENALYFVDDYNNAIYQYQTNQMPISLSDKFGLRKWVIDHKDINTYFDKYNRDLYFCSPTDDTNTRCLTFNETVGNFVSFMDYSPKTMFNIEDVFFDITNSNIREHNAGNALASYIEFIENDLPDYNKILNVLEVRADVYNNGVVEHDELPITSLQVTNEYQDTGEVTLVWDKNIPSNIKKKFRQWNITVPRNGNGQYIADRMRNNWFKIKYNMPANKDIKLYDTISHYCI